MVVVGALIGLSSNRIGSYIVVHLIALVAVAEVRLVNLNTVAGHGVERGVVMLDALDDAHGA